MTPSSTGRRDRTVMADINMTPLIDVMLVLLIIFMVTAPVLLQEMTVQLPKSSVGQANTAEGVVITLGRDDVVYIDKERIPISQFATRIAAARTRIVDRPVFLKADEQVPYGKVIAVMGHIKALGIEKVGLVVEQVRDTSKK